MPRHGLTRFLSLALLFVLCLPGAASATDSKAHNLYLRAAELFEQEKYRLVKKKFPLIASFMLVDMNDYAIARRGSEEQIRAKEKRLMERLKGKD